MRIAPAASDAEIAATFPVMRQLRPHLAEAEYVAQVRALMASDGYRLAALTDDDASDAAEPNAARAGAVRAVAGYRTLTMLYCGRILSVDDFVTDERARSRGYGRRLLDWLKAEGRRTGCAELQLISRVTREAAHRFYYREGLGIECFHFRARL